MRTLIALTLLSFCSVAFADEQRNGNTIINADCTFQSGAIKDKSETGDIKCGGVTNNYYSYNVTVNNYYGESANPIPVEKKVLTPSLSLRESLS